MIFHFQLNFIFPLLLLLYFSSVIFSHKKKFCMQFQLLLELRWILILNMSDNITTIIYSIKTAFLMYNISQISIAEKFPQVQQGQNSNKMLSFRSTILLLFSLYISLLDGDIYLFNLLGLHQQHMEVPRLGVESEL